MDLRSMEVKTFHADAVIFCTGGDWRDFWALDEFRSVHRLGAVGAVSAGRRLRERRIHSGSSDGDSGRRQAAADERVGARRGRPRVGAEKSAR